VKFLFLSTHAFLPTTRKTSVHFVSEALAARGHEVETISVGFSALSYFKKKNVYRLLAQSQKNRFVERAPRYRSACYMPPLHAFSSGNAMLDVAMAPMFSLYGNTIPAFMREAIRRADVVVIESGTAVAFFKAVRRINPSAKTLYFVRDRLDTVGASVHLQKIERLSAAQFDHIIVPSRHIAETFGALPQVEIIPQGIDKQAFDASTVSPYAPGTINAVSVGNMLFDRDAVVAMAKSAPHVTFHLFGEGIPDDLPENAKVYGERPFSDIIAYIKFAHFGVAPYRLTERELYLIESSLKLRQYSYCALPVLAPSLMACAFPNIIGYSLTGETDWAEKINTAATMPHLPEWKDGILSWDEIAERFAQSVDAH